MASCRMVGYISTDRERFGCAMHQLSNVLTTAAGSGYGIAHYSDDALLLNRRPGVEVGGHPFAELTGGVKTRVLMAHTFGVGAADAQARDLHPFKFSNWAFALTGQLPTSEAACKYARTELTRSLPDFLMRNIQGRSCAEALFHHFLLKLHELNQLRDGVHRVEDVAQAMRASAAFVATLAPSDSTDVAKGLNILATDGHRLYLLRRGDKVAQTLQEGIVQCDMCYGGGGDMDSFSLRESHQRFRAVLLAVDVDDVPQGWKAVETETVLVIDKSLEIRVL